MSITRRDFGKVVLGSAAAITGISLLEDPGVSAQMSYGTNNVSYINGVQFGLQPFCYHDLPMNPDNRPLLIKRLVQNGMAMVELWPSWVEPQFGGPGVSPQEARERIRE